jgi:hypothetical protein
MAHAAHGADARGGDGSISPRAGGGNRPALPSAWPLARLNWNLRPLRVPELFGTVSPTAIGAEKWPDLLARSEGFEPPTPRFEVWCSIQLSYERRRAL